MRFLLKGGVLCKEISTVLFILLFQLCDTMLRSVISLLPLHGNTVENLLKTKVLLGGQRVLKNET